MGVGGQGDAWAVRQAGNRRPLTLAAQRLTPPAPHGVLSVVQLVDSKDQGRKLFAQLAVTEAMKADSEELDAVQHEGSNLTRRAKRLGPLKRLFGAGESSVCVAQLRVPLRACSTQSRGAACAMPVLGTGTVQAPQGPGAAAKPIIALL